jgi:hypothetical protein
MKNPSLYIGFTLVSDEADGHQRVSTFDGLSYHGMDGLQITMVQDLLVEEFAERFDALKQDMRRRLVDMGYVNEINNGGVDPKLVEDGRALVSDSGKGKGNRPA